MRHILVVQIKAIYGRENIYPACEQSKLLAKIANTLSLTPHTIKLAKQMGFTFTVKPGPISEQTLSLLDSQL